MFSILIGLSTSLQVLLKQIHNGFFIFPRKASIFGQFCTHEVVLYQLHLQMPYSSECMGQLVGRAAMYTAFANVSKGRTINTRKICFNLFQKLHYLK